MLSPRITNFSFVSFDTAPSIPSLGYRLLLSAILSCILSEPLYHAAYLSQTNLLRELPRNVPFAPKGRLFFPQNGVFCRDPPTPPTPLSFSRHCFPRFFKRDPPLLLIHLYLLILHPQHVHRQVSEFGFFFLNRLQFLALESTSMSQHLFSTSRCFYHPVCPENSLTLLSSLFSTAL